MAAVAGTFFGRPSLAEAAVERTAKVAILYCNNKFLPVLDDLVTDDIARRWYVLEKEADDEQYGTCVVCYEPAELHRLEGELPSPYNARVCNRCNSRVCVPCIAKMREHLRLDGVPGLQVQQRRRDPKLNVLAQQCYAFSVVESRWSVYHCIQKAAVPKGQDVARTGLTFSRTS